MALPTVANLKNAVTRLQAERQVHVKAIIEIDDVFSQLGIKASVPAKRGPKPGKRKVGRRKAAKPVAKKKTATKPSARKSFAVPGPKFVLKAIQAAGKAGATTGAIVKAWDKQGRGGNVYGIIGQLVDEKKVKRASIKGKRGSVHRLA